MAKSYVLVISPDIHSMQVFIPQVDHQENLKKWAISKKQMLKDTKLMSCYTLYDFFTAFNKGDISNQAIVIGIDGIVVRNHFPDYVKD